MKSNNLRPSDVSQLIVRTVHRRCDASELEAIYYKEVEEMLDALRDRLIQEAIQVKEEKCP